MDVIMEFATPVGMFYSDDNLKFSVKHEVLKIINDQKENNLKYLDISKTTPDDLHLRDQFKSLLLFIDEKTKLFSEEVLGIKKDDLKISGMWSNVHTLGSKHHYHQHPNSFVSGVYYPDFTQCEDIGKIVFVDPRQAKNMVYADFVKSSCISNRNIWVTPEPGLLLLFPSWLEHGTEPFRSNNSSDVRISVSFNYQLNRCSYQTMRI
jgi:uncharacterized protein (TIGR02466 family)